MKNANRKKRTLKETYELTIRVKARIANGDSPLLIAVEENVRLDTINKILVKIILENPEFKISQPKQELIKSGTPINALTLWSTIPDKYVIATLEADESITLKPYQLRGKNE